jgi:hypothetical protein
MSSVHKLINSIWRKEELLDPWKEYVAVPVHKTGDKIKLIIIRGITAIKFMQNYIGHLSLNFKYIHR